MNSPFSASSMSRLILYPRSMKLERDELLRCNDDTLLRNCNFDTFRASGPGGQHRNTCDSAVRLTLIDSTIQVSASEYRSQQQNRRLALRKLRRKIALSIRNPEHRSWQGSFPTGKKDERYPLFIAFILDILATKNYIIRDTAGSLNISSNKLIKILVADLDVWRLVNLKRHKNGLNPLQYNK